MQMAIANQINSKEGRSASIVVNRNTVDDDDDDP